MNYKPVRDNLNGCRKMNYKPVRDNLNGCRKMNYKPVRDNLNGCRKMKERLLTLFRVRRIYHYAGSFCFGVSLLLSVFQPAVTVAELQQGEEEVALQPVIYGDIDSVSVIFQRDKAVFYLASGPERVGADGVQDEYGLFEAMKKNNTNTILLSPGSIRFLSSVQYEPEEPVSLSGLSPPEQYSSQAPA